MNFLQGTTTAYFTPHAKEREEMLPAEYEDEEYARIEAAPEL